LKAVRPQTVATLRGALTAVLFVAQASQAQGLESSLDVGGAALRYADTLSTGAATITPHALIDWGSAFVDASGTYSRFTSGGWSTQGSLSASRFIPTNLGFFGEIGAFAGGSSHNDGTRTGEVIANGRVHFSRRSGELFFGAGGGRTWDAVDWRTVVLAEAGASIGSELRSALLTVTPTMVSDSIKYADAQASLSWKRNSRLDFGALLGFRIGDQLTTLGSGARTWASMSAVYRLTSRAALVAGGGIYPVDLTQGFPGGRFLSLSLRLSGARQPTQSSNPPVSGQSPPPDIVPDIAPTVAEFVVRRTAADSVRLRVNAPRARVVEVTGDFTNWTPLRLEQSKDEDWWSATLQLRRGKYQMNVRLNGGQWIVPPGLLSMLDEFGGSVGLLVIE
jgi:hypothetical protein